MHITCKFTCYWYSLRAGAQRTTRFGYSRSPRLHFYLQRNNWAYHIQHCPQTPFYSSQGQDYQPRPHSVYIISALVNNAITTPLLNPSGANLGAKIAWIFVGITGFCALTDKSTISSQGKYQRAHSFKSEGIRIRAEEANRAKAVELKDGIVTPSSV